MKLELPDIIQVIEGILPIPANYNGETKSIHDWVNEQRRIINTNQQLYKNSSVGNDVRIFNTMLISLLMRSVTGERGEVLKSALSKHIRSKGDLTKGKFEQVLKDGKYRWGKKAGLHIMFGVKNYFEKIKWEWSVYFRLAEEHCKDNFQSDELLKIKGIGFKVRDLSLSDFNENYVANDLHVVRVATRIGLLNYGYEFLPDSTLEMGNNPGNIKHYLFLHRLFLKLSESTGGKFKLVDIDRSFWHFGRSICKNEPECIRCPINKLCLTGRIAV